MQCAFRVRPEDTIKFTPFTRSTDRKSGRRVHRLRHLMDPVVIEPEQRRRVLRELSVHSEGEPLGEGLLLRSVLLLNEH